MSISQIWVASGEDIDLNTIEVGWHVYQDIYGDDQTRFFIYWTGNGRILELGLLQPPLRWFCAHIVKYLPWLQFHRGIYFQWRQKRCHLQYSKGISVGYYPSALFTNLLRTTTTVEWGGEIINLKNKGRHTSTQMGSGHFPFKGGLKTSSYFNWVHVFDENNMIKDPEKVIKKVTNLNCYNLEIDNDHYGTNGYGFYYGGPGYNDKCR
ncbi:hypothetical protein MKW98_012398 [Papaver atlanticum]|uniref:Neprosin PEP catalytic domain-containing protein n=1 Tax=Papaver atlanticum TaxID=357466 RepID=A0AAD4T1S1_9MAGN|nr:hypothetical protein MKW98_012398 [Papaver atlanticum]